MSSTEKKLKKFFNKKLVPLSKPYFPLNFDPKVSSYYQKRTKTTMSTLDFELGEDLQQQLEYLWQDDKELLELIPQLLKIAENIKEQQLQQSEEVSPFVYAMF